MTVTLGPFEITIILVFVAFCVIYNYRKGHSDGVDKTIDFLKEIDAVRVVRRGDVEEYQFATHPKNETIQ